MLLPLDYYFSELCDGFQKDFRQCHHKGKPILFVGLLYLFIGTNPVRRRFLKVTSKHCQSLCGTPSAPGFKLGGGAEGAESHWWQNTVTFRWFTEGVQTGGDPTDGISQTSQTSRRGELTPSANKGGQVFTATDGDCAGCRWCVNERTGDL